LAAVTQGHKPTGELFAIGVSLVRDAEGWVFWDVLIDHRQK
jgi:hypothetical protein